MRNASDTKRAYAGQARHKETGSIHEIHELEKLGYGKKDQWICIDERCGAEMTACAWFEKDPPFEKSPYFRVNGSHTDECFVNGLERLAKKGNNNCVSNGQSFPAPYPSKVAFSGKNVEIRGHCLKDGAELGTSSDKSTISAALNCKWYNRTLRTIWMACQFYVDFSHDRHLRFQVQGCNGQTYNEVFVRLGTRTEEVIGSNRIFYDQIMFKGQYNLEKEPLELKLLSTVNLPGGEVRNRQVSIHTDGWSAAERRYLRQQIAEATKKGSKAYREKAEERPWIFSWLGRRITVRLSFASKATRLLGSCSARCRRRRRGASGSLTSNPSGPTLFPHHTRRRVLRHRQRLLHLPQPQPLCRPPTFRHMNQSKHQQTRLILPLPPVIA